MWYAMLFWTRRRFCVAKFREVGEARVLSLPSRPSGENVCCTAWAVATRGGEMRHWRLDHYLKLRKVALSFLILSQLISWNTPNSSMLLKPDIFVEKVMPKVCQLKWWRPTTLPPLPLSLSLIHWLSLFTGFPLRRRASMRCDLRSERDGGGGDSASSTSIFKLHPATFWRHSGPWAMPAPSLVAGRSDLSPHWLTIASTLIMKIWLADPRAHALARPSCRRLLWSRHTGGCE